jgi:hypothetical protein
MKRSVFVLALLAAAITSASAEVPTKVSFTARLVNEETGDVVSGTHRVKFELFDAETGGASAWFEGQEFVIDEDGLLFAELGATKPLDAAIFNGKQLWLEVSLDDKVMEPRIALDSVPYAIRSHAATEAKNAEQLGGKTASDFQSRVTGTCTTGSFLNGVNADGTVTCGAGATGTGDITDVVAGSGLQGGGAAGSVTLSLLQTCAMNQVLKWTGTAWTCQADASNPGDIEGVTAGPGLMGGGTSGTVTVSLLTTCGMNQVLKWNGATWACAADIDTDTNSGGDITSVTTSAASGLTGGVAAGDAALSLLTTCAPQQILRWSGSAWACSADNDTNSGGDVTDVNGGNGLTVTNGGGPSVTLDIGAGTGITVNANDVALNTAFTDARYVDVAGDTITGALTLNGAVTVNNTLNMNQQRITNRGCPAGHVRIGPGLCTEFTDQTGFTFTGCAGRCRGQGTHMCSSAEMRAIMTSGVALDVGGVLLDWVDDQDGVGTALFVTSSAAETMDGSRATSTSSFCRCCANVE